MPKVHFVKSARKADPSNDIEVGDSYYYWTFRYGGKRKSKTPPSRSQLTQSSFLQQLYDLQDKQWNSEDLESEIQEFIQSLEELKDECEISLDNIPEQLREAPAGETLQERIDNLEDWISELESIETEIDEEELKQAAADEFDHDEYDENNEDHVEKFQELLANKQDEILEEIENSDPF